MIKDYFKIEEHPRKGLLPLEWVVLAYMALTFLIMLFTYTKLDNPNAMVWGRIRVLAMTLLLWAVYRMVPCRITKMVRVLAQMLLLAWWYPDTYEINKMLPNFDHIVAGWDQMIFGFQPALVFAKHLPWAVVSELMDMGYFCYYPMIAVVAFFYFFRRYPEFERATFIIVSAFFIYYVVFILFPVVGPTYYYNAVGVEDIARGIFPQMHDYFATHTDCLPAPGYQDGIFYRLVEDAKNAGERPTAAFPSSHIGISTICMMLAWRTRNRTLFWILFPIYCFLCMATVYIQAHYLVDAIAGFISALILYFSLLYVSKDMVNS